MRSIPDTVARLTAFRAMSPGPRGIAAGAGATTTGASAGLATLEAFGTNPGTLTARYHVPAGLPRHAPLVVVLHGCTQTAAGYDHGAGWSTLADRAGFAVLFPEQTRANNANLCFNWFVPEDTRRDGGEALSIRQMIETMILAHDLDRGRVFVTGLSAGGAMTSVMLATYPEVFAGGAIIAGLPFGSAHSMSEAFDRMRGHGGPDDAGLAALVRKASGGHEGPWPRVSVWHGTADRTVAIANMGRIVAQWRGLHGAATEPDVVEAMGDHDRSAWLDDDGVVAIEQIAITGMGHGTPIDPKGPDRLGNAAPHMLDVGVASTALIARAWGLTDSAREVAADAAGRVQPTVPVRHPARAQAKETSERPSGVQKIIEDALRAAGLMR